VTQLLLACRRVLDQMDDLIMGITQEDFCRSSISLGGSTIGQHVRHTLEFFLCLEEGFHEGVVNYDHRGRDKDLETDRSLAIASIKRIHDFVRRQTGDKSLILQAGYLRDSDDSCSISTTYNRELAYNVEHAIHHMAIIKIGVREVAPYVKLEENFGVAASTARHKPAVSGLII
jgi:hypothetical protein